VGLYVRKQSLGFGFVCVNQFGLWDMCVWNQR